MSGIGSILISLMNFERVYRIELEFNSSFDLYIIDSWDGNHSSHGPDLFTFNIDGTSLLSATFSNSGTSQSYPNNYPATTNYAPKTGSVYTYGTIPDGYSMYQIGYGVPKDDKEAVKWYLKAANQRHAKAEVKLNELRRSTNPKKKF